MRRFPYEPSAYDDDWEDHPRQGFGYQWGLGVLVPLALMAYGGYAIAMGRVEFGNEVTMTLRGLNAVGFGVAWISAGVFVHCHYFWGNVYNQAWWAVLGKILGACGFIAGVGFVLVRNGVLGVS